VKPIEPVIAQFFPHFKCSVPRTRAVAQPEWGGRGHGPPWNKLAKIFTGALHQFNFQLLENKRKEQSDLRRRHWLAPPEQNSWLRYCTGGLQHGLGLMRERLWPTFVRPVLTVWLLLQKQAVAIRLRYTHDWREVSNTPTRKSFEAGAAAEADVTAFARVPGRQTYLL